MRPVVVAVLLAISATAHAQSRTETHAAVGTDGKVVRVVTVWGKHSTARLEIGDAKPITLADGTAAGAIATGHDRTVVVLGTDNGVAPFEIRVVDKGKASKPVTLERPNERYDLPFAAALAVTPDGFAAFFQETQSDDPSAAHTYLARLDATGAPVGAVTEIAVPWALADAVWDGTGFHLALIYTEQRGARLSMVTASKDGAPSGHPDWSSKLGVIADVRLVADGGKVRAIYRNNEHLYESDVTQVGSWGREPPTAKDRGALAWGDAFAITAKGEILRVKASR
jgi:hypothetical protein